MKPATFAHYLVQHQTEIMRGWISGAAFEGHVQVLMDQIVRDHLSSRVAIYNNATTGEDVLAQQAGKGALPVPGGQVPYQGWERMREIRYDASTKISDMFISNGRFVLVDDGNGGAFVYKTTEYWIELKVESPGTQGYADFGGKTPAAAMKEDIEKLIAQKQWNNAQGAGGGNMRRRYWYVMLAFSDDRRGYIKSLGPAGDLWTFAAEYMHGWGPMMICIYEA